MNGERQQMRLLKAEKRSEKCGSLFAFLSLYLIIDTGEAELLTEPSQTELN